METAPMPHEMIAPETDAVCAIDTFLETLRREQTHFLDAIGTARSLLMQSGQLAHVSALHGQLTRRFLDAQRSILKRHAEIDAELAMFASGGQLQTPASDGDTASQQLTALLDGWWVAANREGRSIIEAARAARFAASPPDAVVERAPQLSPQMMAVLDAADPDELGPLLTTLADLLDPPAAESTRHEGRLVDDMVIIRLDSVPVGPLPGAVSIDQFQLRSTPWPR